MAKFPKNSFIAYFLTLSLLGGAGATTLTSCIKDADEPYVENSKDNGKDEPSEEPGDDEPGTDEPGTDEPGDVELTDNLKNLTLGETVTTTAVVMAQTTRGLVIADEGGAVYIYNSTYSDLPIGTVVKVSGTLKAFGTGLQFDNTAKVETVGSETVTYPTPTDYTAAMIDQAVANTDYVQCTYVTIEGQLNYSDNYINVIIEGTTAQGSIQYATNEMKAILKDGSTFKLTGYFSGVSNSKYFNIVLTDAVEVENENNEPAQDPDLEIPAAFENEPYGYVVLPTSLPQQVKGYTGFVVNYNKDYHAPNYVSWLLTTDDLKEAVSTSRDYWVDNNIIGCAPDKDGWFDAGYDRGHMCPAADQKWSADAIKDAAVMANMCPQLSTYNQGIWANLEKKERVWAEKYGQVYIVCGPVYEDDYITVGSAKTRVASGFFKAFLYYNGSNSQAIAYLIPHLSSGLGGYSQYVMTVDDLEEATGYDFFAALPEEIQKAVEASYDLSKWN